MQTGHEFVELGEQIAGIVGAGAGLGVVLDAECGQVSAAQALHGVVVEVDVGDVGTGYGAVGHTEVVVLAGDLHRSGGQVAHRVVAAVVAEGELVGLPAQRRGQELVAQADAEDRHLAQKSRDGVHRASHRVGIAGTVG